MTIKEMRDWLITLPDTFDAFEVMLTQGVSEIENAPGKVIVKHNYLTSMMVDEDRKELGLFNQKDSDRLDPPDDSPPTSPKKEDRNPFNPTSEDFTDKGDNPFEPTPDDF